MKQPSIETNLAKEQGFSAFMSAEHIALVLRREQKNKQRELEKNIHEV